MVYEKKPSIFGGRLPTFRGELFFSKRVAAGGWTSQFETLLVKLDSSSLTCWGNEKSLKPPTSYNML